jgi:HSP20 family protein
MSLLKQMNPELTVRSPFSSLRDQFGRLFDIAFPAREDRELWGDWSPALDAFEDKEKYTVSVELPGMKKEDISVSVHDGMLTVSGERKSEKDGKEGLVHRTERYYGKFTRSVSLPATVHADKVSASYKDGVLTVEVPKAEEARPKTIPVN